MKKTTANRLLDRVRKGGYMPEWVINDALRSTGDLTQPQQASNRGAQGRRRAQWLRDTERAL